GAPVEVVYSFRGGPRRPSVMWTRALSLFVLLGAAACGSDVDDRPVSFSYIHAAIILPNCATSGCHSSLTRTRGVDLENKDTAYLVFQNAQNEYQDIILLLKGQVPSYYPIPPDQPL